VSNFSLPTKAEQEQRSSLALPVNLHLMHYLTELANKLVASYRDGKESAAGGRSEEDRRKLVAALRCALELETGKRKREELLTNSSPEYELSETFSSSVMADKD
jgi:hypothetical protein